MERYEVRAGGWRERNGRSGYRSGTHLHLEELEKQLRDGERDGRRRADVAVRVAFALVQEPQLGGRRAAPRDALAAGPLERHRGTFHKCCSKIHYKYYCTVNTAIIIGHLLCVDTEIYGDFEYLVTRHKNINDNRILEWNICHM